MLMRALTHAARNVRHVLRSCELLGHQIVVMRIGWRRKRRIDTIAPSRASGGMMALSRLPSGKRASTIGSVSSTRRPTRPAMRCTICSRCRSSLKATFVSSSRPLPFDVHRLGAVDQDIGNGRIAHQRFERPQPERLVKHFLHQPFALGHAQQVGALPAQFLRGPPHFPAQFLVAHAAHTRQIDAANQLMVQLLLEAQQPFFRRQRLGDTHVWQSCATHIHSLAACGLALHCASAKPQAAT